VRCARSHITTLITTEMHTNIFGISPVAICILSLMRSVMDLENSPCFSVMQYNLQRRCLDAAKVIFRIRVGILEFKNSLFRYLSKTSNFSYFNYNVYYTTYQELFC
jgi:hypothetical protein